MAADEKSPVSRGFVGRRRSAAQAERVPPGQYVTVDFPILSAGPTPHTPLEQWSFALQHGTQRLAEWSWAQFQALKQTSVTVDIHCVTKWSKLDTRWEGVSVETVKYWLKTGYGPRSMKVGKHRRWRLTEIEAWEKSLLRATV